MKRTLTALIIAIAATGCISTKLTRLGQNRYMVTARGGGYTDRAQLMEAAHIKASETCGGEYEIIDRADGGDTFFNRNKDTTVVFRCL